jgi:hypothetical protein
VRPALLTVLLLLLASAAVPAQSQGGASFLEDSAGDVQLATTAAPVGPDAADAYSCIDLRSLALVETRSHVEFTLTVADLKDPSQEPADGCRYNVYFSHNGREFMLALYRVLPSVNAALGGGPFSWLYARDPPSTTWSSVWSSDGDASWDLAADTYAVSVPRLAFVDADGAPPSPGRSFERVRVEGVSAFKDSTLIGGLPGVPGVPMPAYAIDLMPDDWGQAPSFPFQLGVAQTGHARLSSDRPYRASNGEATTYVMNVTASNLADRDDRFTFRAVAVTGGLTVVVPVQVLALDAKASRQVPVLVTVPFNHDHGGDSSFVLEMVSDSDAGSVGRIEMGVRFLTVPQPAGHHNQVYLHHRTPPGALLAFQDGYMNTLEDDPAAEAINSYTVGLSGNGASWTYYWRYRLDPSLEMGLDFDPASDGTIALRFGSTWPILAPTIEGTLYTAKDNGFSGTDQRVLATFEASLGDLLPNAPLTADAALAVLPDVDRVAHEPGRSLFLEVRLRTEGLPTPTLGLANEGPYIAPGGHMQLPLVDWHDPVDAVLASLAGPGLSPLGPQERLVNPGEAVVYRVSIANAANKAATVQLELSGTNTAWASLPASSVQVPANSVAEASIVGRAPAGAGPGERADLVLQAYSKADPAARGLLRFLTTVDTSQDHPDDTAVAADLERRESPGAGVLLLAGLAAAALAARRRR